MADSCDTIGPVTQGTDTGCPPSNGTVSAMSVESVSAINGMRNWTSVDTPGFVSSQPILGDVKQRIV
jgi:hypothetical protein